MPTGNDIINSAKKYSGVKYFEGNPQNRDIGMDCSGIIQQAMSDLGIRISRTTSSQLGDANAGRIGRNIGPDISKAVPGDILHYLGHEEIWLGNGQVFSEATNGTVASVRKKSPYPLVGIVRYSDGTGSLDSSVSGGIAKTAFESPLSPFTRLFEPALWLRITSAILGAFLLFISLKRLAP